MLDLNVYGSSKPFQWTHEHLNRVLSTGTDPVLKNPLIINAFRAIDRADFTPEEKVDLAYLDKGIDIGYSEQMTSPSTIGRMLEILEPQYGGNYLHLGTGTGYLGSLLGFIAGKQGRVYSLERVLWLWEKARGNLKKYPQLTSTSFLLRDGQFGLDDKAPYDGIILSFTTPEISRALIKQLKPGGKLLVPQNGYKLKVIQKLPDESVVEDSHIGFIFNEIKPGLA